MYFSPEPPKAGLVPSCSEAGVLGVLPGIIGTIQASETIKNSFRNRGNVKGKITYFKCFKKWILKIIK